MNRASRADGNRVHIFCPGCNVPHGIVVGSWTWNGSLELPTFSPSLLTHRRVGNNLPLEHQDFRWTDEVCHCFVNDGLIQFLTDSTHHLAGQTVDLPEWPYGKE